MNFYFFVASLPTLKLGAPSPVTLEAFRADAARLLPLAVANELDDLLLARSPNSSFARAWHEQDVQLRNAVALFRASRRDDDAPPRIEPSRNYNVWLDRAVAEACGKSNPLERELALDQVRWNTADELSRETPFGLAGVLAYGLKLKLVERWAALTDDAGQAALLQAVKSVRDAAKDGGLNESA